MYGLAQDIERFFVKLNRLAANPWIRFISPLFAGRTLIRYYKNHYESVKMGLEEARKGHDLLFHGAPALIVIHSSTEGSLPRDDAQYAAYNITLLAHSLGLGSCFIGYASETLNRARDIRIKLGIPVNNRVHAVLVLGYPDVQFHRLSLRKQYSVAFYQ